MTRAQTDNRHATRHGVALLIVLGTLVAVSTSALLIARGGILTRTETRLRLQEQNCQDMLRAAESPIHEWLRTTSGKVVLPPDTSDSCVSVFEDEWNITLEVDSDSPISCLLRITAWDQCGMTPAEPGESLLGVDLFESEPGVSPFPDPSAYHELASDTVAPGARLATHNPARRNGSPRLNVNTAPLPLVSRLLREAGIDGIEQVSAARRERKPAAISDLRVAQRGDRSSIRIAGESNAWAFRIDVTVGSVNRSWWEVWVNAGSGWQRVQRLEIP